MFLCAERVTVLHNLDAFAAVTLLIWLNSSVYKYQSVMKDLM